MVILQDAGGNVGIGTKNPATKLHVEGVSTFGGFVHFNGSRTYLDGHDYQQSANASVSTHWLCFDDKDAFGFRITGSPGGESIRQVVVGPGWTKNFLVDHPLYNDRYLVHATLEGPEAGVYYRGEARLENGEATVLLPGYFEALTRTDQRTVLVTPRLDEVRRRVAALAVTEVRDGKFTVVAVDGSTEGQWFYWEVKAVRKDVASLDAEPLKGESYGSRST
jgi:hypothetical protein